MSDARNSSVESRNCQRHCRQNGQTLVGDACLDQGMHTPASQDRDAHCPNSERNS